MSRVADSEDGLILYSPVVLRELEINLNRDDYEDARNKIKEEQKLCVVEATQEDKNEARKLESKYNFEISFYDLVHMAISKRLGATLITRDRRLLEVSRENGINAKKPENILGPV